jgi:hypothetical protein
MKYFYYISKPKVQMLQAQSRKPRFRLTSISSKLGFGAASVTINAEKQSATLINETLSLVRNLEKTKSLRPSSDLSKLDTAVFYHDQGLWHSDLFKFGSDFGSPTVTYALWRVAGDSLILLIGSPNNILGDKIVNGDCFVPGTSGAHLEILAYVDQCLTVDEPAAVRVGPSITYGRNIPVPEPTNSPIIFPEDYDERAYKRDWSRHQEDKQSLQFLRNERGLSLAFLCLRQLTQLNETSLETVFRVFSVHDIPAEHETERFEGSWQFTPDELIQQARDLGILDFERIYLGSPVYTALE